MCIRDSFDVERFDVERFDFGSAVVVSVEGCVGTSHSDFQRLRSNRLRRPLGVALIVGVEGCVDRCVEGASVEGCVEGASVEGCVESARVGINRKI